MKDRPKARLIRIDSMGNELVSLNIMAEEVGTEVRQLTERWASLEEKVGATLNHFPLPLVGKFPLALHIRSFI